MSDRIRILAVDDHPILRSGVIGIINAQPDMVVVAEASDAAEAVTEYRKHKPDVTLMDVRLGATNGINAIDAIRSISPGARLIVLTTYSGDVLAMKALKAGAAGYLLKSMLRTELLETIRRVHAGGKVIPPEIAREIAEHALDDNLSAREIEVLTKVANGYSNKRIADVLKLSEYTVKGHLKSLMSKLSASDRTHAVTIAIARGILDGTR